MNQEKFKTGLAVVISVIVIGGFFGLQNLFMDTLRNDAVNYNPAEESLGNFVNIDTPTPTSDPEKVVESIFVGTLSEFDQALMADEDELLSDYDSLINLIGETYEDEI